MECESQSFIDACQKIEEDSLYTAQAHFIESKKWYRKSLWLIIIPALIAGLSGFIVAIGGASWIAAFAAIGGLIPAISSWVGVEKDNIRHENAGRLFTALRHEVRMLREVFGQSMQQTDANQRLKELHNEYLMLVKTQELTDDKSFRTARENIQKGIFLYDCKESPTEE